MRLLVIPTLSTLILLCAPITTPQGRELKSTRWPPLTINLLRVGAPAVRAYACERGAAPGVQESVALEPGNPVERELSGGQSHS